ncbi:M14 family zinc carboxypeptidase [Virgibacillus oceani]
MLSDLEKLASVYPFITQQVIGKSVMGKEIIDLQIGRGSEKNVHVNGSFHTNEWITPLCLSFYKWGTANILTKIYAKTIFGIEKPNLPTLRRSGFSYIH